MLPKLVVESGALLSMTRSQCRIYIALVIRTHWGTDKRAIVSQEQLAEDTGIKPRNIRNAIFGTKPTKNRQASLGLVQLGIVRVVSVGCGRGKASIYEVVTHNPDAGVPLSQGQNRMQGDTKRGCNEPQKGTHDVQNPDARIPPKEGKESKEVKRSHATGVASDQSEEDPSQTVNRLMNATRRGGVE